MSTTFRKSGKKANLVASGVVASGDVIGPYGTGNRFAIAIADAADGGTFAGSSCGVHELPALATGSWADGDTLYWDATNSQLTSSSSGNQSIGSAYGAKAGGDESANVLLNNLPD